MRLLFEINKKNYNPNGVAFTRHSARCLNLKDGKIAMIYSRKYNYYKFPGGGIEDGEDKLHALQRETLEEAGLKIIPHTIKPYGYVRRIEKSERVDADYFLQDNYYYLCEVEDEICNQSLEDYEREEGFTLQYVSPTQAIYVNRNFDHGPKPFTMLERECKVLELMISEGYFSL